MSIQIFKIRNKNTGLFYSTSRKSQWSDDPKMHAIYTEEKYCKQIITMYSKPYHGALAQDFIDSEIVAYDIVESYAQVTEKELFDIMNSYMDNWADFPGNTRMWFKKGFRVAEQHINKRG
jgi:hypothetical protein